MRFTMSDTAVALRDAVAGLLDAKSRRSDPRRLAGRQPGLVSAAWRKLAAVGAIGTLVPEERGGLGLDETSLVPLLEEVGLSGLPGPVAETIAVAAPLLDGEHLAGMLAGDDHGGRATRRG